MGLCQSLGCCVETPVKVERNPDVGYNIEDLEREDVKTVSLDGEVCLGWVPDVYDGDTCTVNLKSSLGIQQWKIRMQGYDSPEKRPKKADFKDGRSLLEHKQHGLACGNLLRKLIRKKYVAVKCGGQDKYGRLLGRIYVVMGDQKEQSQLPMGLPTICDATPKDLENLDKLCDMNEWMVAMTPSIPYDGGTKAEFNFKGTYPTFYWQELQNVKRS